MVVDTLGDNGFLVSTPSHTTKCAPGKLPELYHSDAKAEFFPVYVQESYPQLAAKMSCIQNGYFTSS